MSKIHFTEMDVKRLGRNRRRRSMGDRARPWVAIGVAMAFAGTIGYVGYGPAERLVTRASAAMANFASGLSEPAVPYNQMPVTRGALEQPVTPATAVGSLSQAESLANRPGTDNRGDDRLAALGLPERPTGIGQRLVTEDEYNPSLLSRLRDRFTTSDEVELERPEHWAGIELWMEPFLPFQVDGSIDRIVATMAENVPDPFENYTRVVVRSGDSFARIMNRLGVSPGEQHRILRSGSGAEALANLHPGDELFLNLDESRNNRLQALRFQVNTARTLLIQRSEDGEAFISRFEDQPYETRRLYATGTIDRSLYLAARRAGLSHRQIIEFMSIFEWQVDFAREIKRGDTFSIVYEAEFVNGSKVRDGRIVAAALINDERRLEAVHFETEDGLSGYFDSDGNNLMKAFLRRPVQNARISSGYDQNRKHPILGVRRPHLGTDFAAPTGTPILAAGSGRIAEAGRNGGYGNRVVIEHGSRISTLYAHMSRFAPGITRGARVERGDVIGYVGATGLATGPHLHYEYKVGDRHQDPMQVDLPNGDAVPAERLAEFQSSTASLLASLQRITETQLAMTGQPGN